MEGDRAFMSRKHLRSYRRRSPSTSPSTGGGNRHQSHSPSPVPREVTSKGLDQVKKGRNMDSERMGHREGDYQRRRVEDGAVERPTASHSRSLHSDHDQSRRPLAGTSDYCEQGQSNRDTRPHSHHEHLRSDSDRLGRYDRPEQYGGGYREKDVDRGVQMFKVKERDTEREKGRDRDRVRGSDDDYLRSKDQEREPKRSRESDDRKRVDCSRDAGELIDADRPREWQEIRRRDLHRERDMVKDQSRERIMDRDRAWPRIRRDEEPTVKDQSRHRNLDKERSWSRDNRDEEGAELRKRNCRDIGGEGTAASAGTSVLHRDTNGGKGERVEWDGGENDSRRDTSEIHKVVRGKGERDRREREKGVTGWDQILMQDTTGTDEGATSCSIDKTVQHEVATPIDSSVDPKPELKDKAEETDGSKGARHSIGAFQPTVPDSGQGQEKQVPSSSVVKPVKISKWGPPPSSEDAMTAELANDLNAAKVAALRAAELVNKNMGIAGFFSSEYKKKLLWGSKKAAVEQLSYKHHLELMKSVGNHGGLSLIFMMKEPVVAAAGTNRWDTVHFSDPERQDKFQKLMGVKGDIKDAEVPPPPVGAAVFTEEKQRELQEDLERQFTQGLRRRDGRTVGLGL